MKRALFAFAAILLTAPSLAHATAAPTTFTIKTAAGTTTATIVAPPSAAPAIAAAAAALATPSANAQAAAPAAMPFAAPAPATVTTIVTTPAPVPVAAPVAVAPAAPAVPAFTGGPQALTLKDGTVLTVDGTLAYTTSQIGGKIPAHDGAHVLADGRTVTTLDGRITAMTPAAH